MCSECDHVPSSPFRTERLLQLLYMLPGVRTQLTPCSKHHPFPVQPKFSQWSLQRRWGGTQELKTSLNAQLQNLLWDLLWSLLRLHCSTTSPAPSILYSFPHQQVLNPRALSSYLPASIFCLRVCFPGKLTSDMIFRVYFWGEGTNI